MPPLLAINRQSKITQQKGQAHSGSRTGVQNFIRSPNLQIMGQCETAWELGRTRGGIMSIFDNPAFQAMRDFYDGPLEANEVKELISNIAGFFSVLHEWSLQAPPVTELKQHKTLN